MEHIDLDHRGLAACAYALIDPQCGDAHGADAWRAFPQHDLTPRGWEAHGSGLPRLLELRGLASDEFLRLVTLVLDGPAGQSPCVALLQTSVGTESMQLRLRNLLAPRFPQGAQGLFLFHDPIVFESLSWMLEPPELACLLGSIDRWLLPLRAAWCAVTNPGDAIQRSIAFRLRAETWQRVYRIGAIHAVLDHEAAWRDAPATFGPQVESLLIRAQSHQLTDRDDAVAFAIHGLRWHARIDRHPRVRAMLEQCAGHPMRYQRLTGGWNDADWQAIAAELETVPAHTVRPTRLNHASQGVCQ